MAAQQVLTSEANDFLVVVIKRVDLFDALVVQVLRNLPLAFHESTLDDLFDVVFAMQVGHLLGEHLVDELKVLIKLGATGVSRILRYNFLFVRAADDAHIVCIVLSLFSTGRESRLGQLVS